MCGIAGWLGASADGKDSADGMVRALRRRGPDADGIKSWPQATRCVRLGGVVAMIEPWVTPWSRFVYTRLHHEPFQPEAEQWEFPVRRPRSGANGALPYIIFVR